MCGIIGVLSNHEVAPILVESLKRIEYRGYDSAGLATVNNGYLDCRRAAGKLVNLSDLLVHDPLPGKTGIGHTRWATHGQPTLNNAHPHHFGKVAVVHNGIIENYLEIRAEMAVHGFDCTTDTDTETIAMLAHYYMMQTNNPTNAALSAINQLKGAFALAFLFEDNDDLIIATRRGSPLAIGYGDTEMYVGSDALALAPLTKRLTYLEDGDCAVVNKTGAEILGLGKISVKRSIKVVSHQTTHPDKQGYKHFMEKEIAEQPSVIDVAIKNYLTADCTLETSSININFRRFDHVILVACGTAHYACMVAKYWFESLAQLPVEVDIASEFRYREPPIPDKTLTIFVSQSGETADTLEALRYCQTRAKQIVSIVNVTESSIARESDVILPIYAGVEIGVASTKAFSCQLTVLLILALQAAIEKDELSDKIMNQYLASLKNLPKVLSSAIAKTEQIRHVATQLSQARDVLFLGRGVMYPLALEGALKLKEISYIHAEGYASGELKHGPIALIDSHIPVVMLAPPSPIFPKAISNMQEVLARKGKVILISDAYGIKEAGYKIYASIEMPEVSSVLAPILYSIPVQLLAYFTAVLKGTDVDQPRNLAKSVTVE
ncbi:MAG: glutamine--fructose-6-phosphate transaminase (isomerizing) [Aestuariivita sp.]|nr:glutamine--fructose-6-phosphate transaminase (isomerizing) [Aestuariivita sp.]